jgi:hypothetical protein
MSPIKGVSLLPPGFGCYRAKKMSVDNKVVELPTNTLRRVTLGRSIHQKANINLPNGTQSKTHQINF